MNNIMKMMVNGSVEQSKKLIKVGYAMKAEDQKQAMNVNVAQSIGGLDILA